MRIQDMFAKGIDRPINGVVKVNQDELDILVQELDEYVITRELKKHIILSMILTLPRSAKSLHETAL